MNQLPENELIALLKKGDHHAYEQLFNLYWKKAFTIAHRKCGNENDALDIVQTAFSQLWENREKLNINGSFAAWITAVIKYKVIDYYRSSQTHITQKKLLLQQLEAQQVMKIEDSNAIACRELQQDWQAAVDCLPGRMKEVYLLSCQSDLSITEIAGRLSIHPQSVKNQLSKAKERLRRMLEHHFFLF